MLPPKLDNRSLQDILADCQALAAVHTPDWQGAGDPSDPARAMLDLFARLYELLLDRFNDVPEKNFVSFLDFVGVEQFPGRPAEAPVTFLLSKQATAGGFVPAASQVSTIQTENADAEVFETRNGFFATPAKLRKIVNLVPAADGFSEISLPVLPPSADDVVPDPLRAVTSLTAAGGSLLPVDHVLFVGSEALFGRKEPVDASLLLSLSGSNAVFTAANLEWRVFISKAVQWLPLNPQPAYDLTQASRVKVTFSSLSGIEKSIAGGQEDFWVAGFFIGDFAAVPSIPAITAVTGTIAPPAGTTPALLPDSAYINASKLDLSKPFLPFGRRPAYGDALYFSSTLGFAPDVGAVTLTFAIRPYTDDALRTIFKNITADTTLSTSVDWQYLDNTGTWRTLVTYTHTLKVARPAPFTITRTASGAPSGEDGTLFGINAAASAVVEIPVFPADIGLQQVNGEKNYWLRALLKTDNPYGGDAFVVMSGTTPLVVGPTFIPPSVENVQILYSHRSAAIPASRVQTRNNFQSAAFVPGASGSTTPFSPFVSLPAHTVNGVVGLFAPEPAIYLGFDAPFGSKFISLLAYLADIVSAATFPLETGAPQIAWEYLNAALQWKPLDVTDGTGDLRTSGVVSFVAPDDSAALSLFSLLLANTTPPALYWYRARLTAGSYDHPPQVLGFYLNTVLADNKTTHRQAPDTIIAEFLIGSANGEQDQAIDLIQRPVLSGELWVREPEIPSLTDLNQLLADFQENEDAISPPITGEDLYWVRVPAATDAEPEIWVWWLRVPNFLSSAPRSRHYTLEAVSGRLTFGDNTNGLIPPAGKDNLVLRDFQTGGGEEPNSVAVALAIKDLKTSLPFVDKVFNVQKAEGGGASWSIDEALRFGPQIVKNRGRAVTTEDYEWMVLQEFSQVKRVRCLAIKQPAPGGMLAFKPGAVTLVIVPDSVERLPEPSQRLLTSIRDFLAAKTLGNIISDIYAIGPDFKEVRVEAIVVAKIPEEASIVGRRVARAIEAFLHPLTGGEAGNGWEFGRSVFLSEIFAVMERTDGVDHVASAKFADDPLATEITVGENSLAASGAHLIHIG